MKLTACTAPQSEVTKPLKPSWSRRMVVSVSLLPQANVPLSAVVGAHDGGHAGLHGCIEGRDIDFVQGLIIHENVAAVRVVSRHSA